MQHGEALATLRSWETRFPVHEWIVGGVHAWPLVRIHLSSRLLAVGEQRPPRFDSAVARFLRNAVRNGTAWKRGPVVRSPHQANAVFLTRPSNRQYIEGRWYDRFFDPIADILDAQKRTSLSIEWRPDGTHHVAPRYRPALVVRSPVTRRYIVSAVRPITPISVPGFDDFAAEVSRSFPSIAAMSSAWLARQVDLVERLARYFGALLRRVNPQAAFCSVYYTPVGMAFCLAASRLKVPSIDVQHGVTVGNPAYEDWTNVPPSGYALLPTRFWCWSEADAKPVRTWQGSDTSDRAIVGGHPWFAFWNSPQPLIDSLRAQVPKRLPGTLTVLVTLSWSTGLSETLQSLLRHAPAEWRWWIRLHPLMERDRAGIRAWCETNAAGKAIVDLPTDLPLPLLLEAADVHLTHNSSVVQEAARAGVPSVVVDRRALDVYEEELSSGWAVYAADEEAVRAAIVEQQYRRSKLSVPAAYPSWDQMAGTIRHLMSDPARWSATALAASSPTHGPA